MGVTTTASAALAAIRSMPPRRLPPMPRTPPRRVPAQRCRATWPGPARPPRRSRRCCRPCCPCRPRLPMRRAAPRRRHPPSRPKPWPRRARSGCRPRRPTPRRAARPSRCLGRRKASRLQGPPPRGGRGRRHRSGAGLYTAGCGARRGGGRRCQASPASPAAMAVPADEGAADYTANMGLRPLQAPSIDAPWPVPSDLPSDELAFAPASGAARLTRQNAPASGAAQGNARPNAPAPATAAAPAQPYEAAAARDAERQAREAAQRAYQALARAARQGQLGFVERAAARPTTWCARTTARAAPSPAATMTTCRRWMPRPSAPAARCRPRPTLPRYGWTPRLPMPRAPSRRPGGGLAPPSTPASAAPPGRSRPPSGS